MSMKFAEKKTAHVVLFTAFFCYFFLPSPLEVSLELLDQLLKRCIVIKAFSS